MFRVGLQTEETTAIGNTQMLTQGRSVKSILECICCGLNLKHPMQAHALNPGFPPVGTVVDSWLTFGRWALTGRSGWVGLSGYACLWFPLLFLLAGQPGCPTACSHGHIFPTTIG